MTSVSQTTHITLTGARENNLKNISLSIPKRQITVFTGVSGSGKSSIVFDTVAAEAQRQLNETFTAFVRNFLPSYGQPDVDAIDNLSAAIIVDQKRIGGNSRSTVGTITDIYTLLRLLFSRVGKPYVGYSNVFSFNDPQGMCPGCEGIGKAITLDLDKKLSDYSEDEWQALLYGEGKVPFEWQGGSINTKYEGLVDKFTRVYIRKDGMSERNREIMLRFVTAGVCQSCGGTRLNEAARSAKIGRYNIAQLAAMEATELVEAVAAFTDPIAAPMVESLVDRLTNLITIGLGYLSLDRETATLSGGSQGGQIVFEGTPRQLLAATGSHTADFLRRDVDASPALRTFI
jgi:excinuclease UvrABC ATPase subunit